MLLYCCKCFSATCCTATCFELGAHSDQAESRTVHRSPRCSLCVLYITALLTITAPVGRIKEIGVSNWLLPNLIRMKQLGQQLPAVNQIEQHIGWHDDQMLDWCHQHGIVVQAASPLSRSLPALVKPGVNPVVSAIAQKHGKSPAQVALRWLIEKGVSPIPSASSLAYQKENLEIFDFSLSDADVVSLAKLALPCRGAAADGLQKCWADPAVIMCSDENGRMFHCP